MIIKSSLIHLPMGPRKTSYLLLLLAGIGLFLVSTGVSYAFFNFLKPSGLSDRKSPGSVTPTLAAKKSKIDPSIPRTETCPLNGEMFTKQERDVWESHRPLGIMIENSVDARPQSGLSIADIVYEAVAEGGITRFMGVFYCDAALSGNITIAPVRSARIYFVNLISEYDGLYNHVGGAGTCDDPNVDPRAKAICLINTARIKDLDQFGRAGDFKTCHRVANRTDKEVAYEHTMACFLDELYKIAAKWKWTNVDEKGVSWDKNFVPWKFQDAKEQLQGEPAATVSYAFWGNSFEGAFDVKWEYDAAQNAYRRSNGGALAVDHNTGDPLIFNTVVVQFAKETSTGDVEKHMLYDVISSGKAIIFMDGVATPATWSKISRTARTIYKDSKGKEIKFNPGPIWISILPIGNEVSYN
ncbi:MAG: hypothetical protein UX87_C0002G0003 [Candidatus Amesbacteria bacterium GW2011_GWA1_47_16]|uniref:DUF3048 domain-containing protein n=5 Tax=Candidatus Amesiibacteriota TaxID=1752730 RepID=A0A0G1S0G0_9BACT|nr:MAG: hypothetical protein UX86_C0037G0009 [Candidatus Amesbacteria bacterium GW2011_GWC1_47_15]KKU64981.1 MAG: hypothetical protein UX87_C0002G0003 [Candidatus Amesbacteria bacterium GW2011_GWA1_47_16]